MMAKWMYFLCLPVLFWACSDSPQSAEEVTLEDTVQITSTDSTVAINDPDIREDATQPEAADSLSFFDELRVLVGEEAEQHLENIDFMEQELGAAYAAIQTQEDLKAFYFGPLQKGQKVLQKIADEYAVDYDSDQFDWSKINQQFEYYLADQFCSECMFEVAVDAYPFYDRAGGTLGTDDDVYFTALWHAFGRPGNGDQDGTILLSAPNFHVGNNYNFYEMDCDFCSYSKLGTGVYKEIINFSFHETDSVNLYKSELHDLNDNVINSMRSNCYIASKSKVIKTIETLQDTYPLSPKHTEQLEALREEIYSGAGISFNRECDFGF